MRSGRCNQRGEHEGQRNEGHIPHDKFGRRCDRGRIEGTHVRPIVNLDARIGLQLPGQLTVTHVHSDD